MRAGNIIQQFTAKDGRKVILRTPKWEDLDDITEFINSLVDEGAEIAVTQRVTREQEAEWLGRTLASLENDKEFRLVAEIDGKVIANSEITKYSGTSSHICGLGIAIQNGYRDIGIGTRMMECLISQGKKWGLKLIELSVFGTNDRAIHVYRKLGFKQVGIKPNYIFKEGKYIDQVDMMLEI